MSVGAGPRPARPAAVHSVGAHLCVRLPEQVRKQDAGRHIGRPQRRKREDAQGRAVRARGRLIAAPTKRPRPGRRTSAGRQHSARRPGSHPSVGADIIRPSLRVSAPPPGATRSPAPKIPGKTHSGRGIICPCRPAVSLLQNIPAQSPRPPPERCGH